MKKGFYTIIMGITTFSLMLCGSTAYADETNTRYTNQASAEEVQTVTEEQLYNIGETAHGSIFDVTVTSAEVVDKIENGILLTVWSPTKGTGYKDVTAESGYSIIRITYQTKYHGKSNGKFPFTFEIDYDDGYLFTPSITHLVPKLEGGIGFKEEYNFPTSTTFEINDPLSYKGGAGTIFIAVNDVVLSNTEPPLILRVEVPKTPDRTVATAFPASPYNYSYESGPTNIVISGEGSEIEFVSFDLRPANLGADPSSIEDSAHIAKDVEGTAKGFGGNITVKMTVVNGTINAISISAANETLGRSVTSPTFADQFLGKTLPVALSDIDAIAGATVTSTAVINAINEAK